MTNENRVLVLCKKKGKHLSKYERGQIAALYKEGCTPYRIGKILGRSANTIRNELKRGTTTIIKHYFEKKEYVPELGQAIYERNKKRAKTRAKVSTCAEFLDYVEEAVLTKKLSFDAARGRAILDGHFKKEETVSVTTLYRYTDKGILKVRNLDLPEKVGRRIRKEVQDRKHKRLNGQCIEQRDKEIEKREEFGNWEIDLVIGKQSGDNVLLTLTERKTRKEIIKRLESKTVVNVMGALQQIFEETRYSSEIFKTITTDNGTEFSRLFELEEEKGISVYYAHPYSSWERGSNERANRIIRRFIRKGSYIKNYTKKKIEEVESWMNNLPRRMFGYYTSEEMYRMELDKIISSASASA